jgi:hypothetical protein
MRVFLLECCYVVGILANTPPIASLQCILLENRWHLPEHIDPGDGRSWCLPAGSGSAQLCRQKNAGEARLVGERYVDGLMWSACLS